MDEKREPEDPRVRLAGERTLLAWVRTGLAMMGFGFVVARFGLFLREIEGVTHGPPAPTGFSLVIGTLLVLLGVAVNLFAAADHYAFLRRLELGEPYRPSRWSLGIVIAVILAVIGVGMTAYFVFLTP
jgi:putative membrane protein